MNIYILFVLKRYENKIKEFINVKYCDPQISLSSVGDEFFITEIYLSKLFKTFIPGPIVDDIEIFLREYASTRSSSHTMPVAFPRHVRSRWKR